MSTNLLNCTPVDATAILYPIVDEVVRRIVGPIAKARDPKCTGGLFTAWRPGDPEVVIPIIGFPIGCVAPNRFVKYTFFANEKCARLGAHPEHISSWQSRDESDPDPMKHKYGGAIRCNNGVILSFSGFSGLEDEAIAAIVAHMLGLLGATEIGRIIAASGNQLLASYIAGTLA